MLGVISTQSKYMLRLIILALLLCPVIASAQTDAEVEQKKRDLDKLKKEVEQMKARRSQLLKQEKNIVGQLEDIDQDLKIAEKMVKDYSWILHVTDKKINKLAAEIDSITVRLERRQNAMSKRLRAIFVYGKYSDLEVLFSADSFNQMIERFEFLKLIAEQDRVLYDDIKAAQAALVAKHAELEQKHADTRQILVEKKHSEDRIEQRKVERKQLLSSVQNDRLEHEKMIAEKKKAAQRIESFFANLLRKQKEARKREGGGGKGSPGAKEPSDNIAESNHYLYKNRGKLPWPVRGKVIEGYGKRVHPKYNTVTFNKGIDIGAAQGQTVSAIYKGKVIFADWFSGYGNLVIVDHDGGFFSLYAHLDDIGVSAGGSVEQGSAIGTVGNTGSTKEPHLHFEIRYQDQTINPSSWLK